MYVLSTQRRLYKYGGWTDHWDGAVPVGEIGEFGPEAGDMDFVH